MSRQRVRCPCYEGFKEYSVNNEAQDMHAQRHDTTGQKSEARRRERETGAGDEVDSLRTKEDLECLRRRRDLAQPEEPHRCLEQVCYPAAGQARRLEVGKLGVEVCVDRGSEDVVNCAEHVAYCDEATVGC